MPHGGPRHLQVAVAGDAAAGASVPGLEVLAGGGGRGERVGCGTWNRCTGDKRKGHNVQEFNVQGFNVVFQNQVLDS